MKRINKYKTLVLAAIMSLMFSACDQYLDQTPDAQVSDEDIFSTYRSFQGFLDQCYAYVIPYNSHALCTSYNIGDHAISTQNWSTAKKAEDGDYRRITGETNNNQNNFRSVQNPDIGDADKYSGIWAEGWRGIRAANLALEQLDMLTNSTNEEKRLIEGQAYFFRAYFHWEIVRAFGGMPYVDKYLLPEDEIFIPRLNYRESTEKMVEDLDRAVELLPEDWDLTSIGSQFKGANAGRATKGAALAIKAKALLYAGSPLMVAESGGGFTYDSELMNRAASAAYEVIKLADIGVYSLVPFEEYNSNFGRNDGTYPWTSETIFEPVSPERGSGQQTARHGRLLTPARFGGNGICETPTQNLVDEFEMANGLPIDDPASGYDPMDPWSNRDPRFRNGILVDRDQWTFKDPDKRQIEFFKGGQDDNGNHRSPYLCKKYWPKGVNTYDRNWDQFVYVNPHIRLAEIYLIYAEAVNEVSGPNGTASGAGLTPVQAVNIVRNRAGMPNVNPKFTGNKEAFRMRIWNERSVELFFEGNRWFDIRRWHVAHLDEYKMLYRLDFDKDYSYFNKTHFTTRVFDEKHYWLPIYTYQTQIYSGFSQNPGW